MSLVCLDDFEEFAKQTLSQRELSYFLGGSDDEVTLRENREAFKRFKLRPRLLRGISSVDMSTTVLGEEVSMPICIAPFALHKVLHPEGEMATARAAARAKTCMVLSMVSNTHMEEVAQAAPDGLKWFQLYPFKDRDYMKQLLDRAAQAGFKAFVLTVDAPVAPMRRDLLRTKFGIPTHLSLPHFEKESNTLFNPRESINFLHKTLRLMECVSWDTVKWLRSNTRLPVILKGIITAEDAVLAVEHGVQGIIVSNHGGRQLDGVLSAVEALPEVVAAVQGRVEVYMDSGVRLGTDVLKALALGARAVFIGRPVAWGLAFKGKEGVSKVLEMLREEFRLAMVLSGCGSLADIDKSLLAYQRPSQL